MRVRLLGAGALTALLVPHWKTLPSDKKAYAISAGTAGERRVHVIVRASPL